MRASLRCCHAGASFFAAAAALLGVAAPTVAGGGGASDIAVNASSAAAPSPAPTDLNNPEAGGDAVHGHKPVRAVIWAPGGRQSAARQMRSSIAQATLKTRASIAQATRGARQSVYVVRLLGC